MQVIWSHPAGVRGLKQLQVAAEGMSADGRTPQGCVD